MARAHFRDSVVAPKTIDGQLAQVLLTSATVNVYEDGTTTPIGVTMYSSDAGAGTLTNPLTTDSVNGEIDFWLDEPRRVDLKITKAGYTTRTVTVDVQDSGDEEASVDVARTFTAAQTFNVVKIKGPRPFADVMAHGAQGGNGVVDDSAAIQAASDAAGINGIVFFPAGIYRVDQKVKFYNGQLWCGAGPTASQIKGNSLTTAVISSDNTAASRTGITIRDLYVTNVTRAAVNSIGIDFTNISASLIDNVRIEDVEQGVKFTGGYNRFSNMTVRTVNVGFNSPASGAVFEGITINTCNAGFQLGGSSAVLGCHVEQFTVYGIYFNGSKLAATGCYFENIPSNAADAIHLDSNTGQAFLAANFSSGCTNFAGPKKNLATILAYDGSTVTPWNGFGCVPRGPVEIRTAADHNLLIRDSGGLLSLDVINDSGSAFGTMRFEAAAFNFATGTVVAPASVAGGSSARLPHGTAPTSPINGDMWTTTAGLFVRINGATVGPLS